MIYVVFFTSLHMLGPCTIKYRKKLILICYFTVLCTKLCCPIVYMKLTLLIDRVLKPPCLVPERGIKLKGTRYSEYFLSKVI